MYEQMVISTKVGFMIRVSYFVPHKFGTTHAKSMQEALHPTRCT